MASDHIALTSWTLSQLEIRNDNHILDIGCGSGLAIKMLSDIVTEGKIVGVDYSPVMLRQAEKRNRQGVKEGKIAIYHSNVSQLPFADDSFDKVCTIESFYFWPDPCENLREVRRVLRPGGTAAIAMEISKEGRNESAISDTAQRLRFPIYSGKEMIALLSAAGFLNVYYKSIPEREKGWLCVVGSS
jgi:ubiquinone/menaquinone biosynthesis C-methylase UbiE